MKKSLLFFILLLQLHTGLAQKKKDLSIFKNSKNWKTEVITFPIEWAPKLTLKGFEELLFTPEWPNPKSDEFWSMVIGWQVNSTSPLSLKVIKHNFKSYFDGLMKPNHWATTFPDPKVHLKSQNNAVNFIGEMTFFDGFHTGKVITVYIQGTQKFDQERKTSLIVFRLSPKGFKHRIWKRLNEAE